MEVCYTSLEPCSMVFYGAWHVPEEVLLKFSKIEFVFSIQYKCDLGIHMRLELVSIGSLLPTSSTRLTLHSL